jgi:hypothetical protein
MSRNFRVAILRARHERSAGVISDAACAGVIIANGRGPPCCSTGTRSVSVI